MRLRCCIQCAAKWYNKVAHFLANAGFVIWFNHNNNYHYFMSMPVGYTLCFMLIFCNCAVIKINLSSEEMEPISNTAHHLTSLYLISNIKYQFVKAALLCSKSPQDVYPVSWLTGFFSLCLQILNNQYRTCTSLFSIPLLNRLSWTHWKLLTQWMKENPRDILGLNAETEFPHGGFFVQRTLHFLVLAIMRQWHRTLFEP